jgi:hypothetical protein
MNRPHDHRGARRTFFAATIAAVLLAGPPPRPARAAAIDDFSAALANAARASRAAAAGREAPAQIGKKVALTPDEIQIIVSTNVGDERWAITANLEQGTSILTLAGNVLTPTEAVILWCNPTQIHNWQPGQDVHNATIDYDCYDALGPSSWEPLNSVTLQGSFLLP